MSGSYFSQQCPICGRHLLIRVEYLGKRVTCQHCHGELIACDPACRQDNQAEPADRLLRRADELLESMDRQQAEQRTTNPR